MLMWHLGDSLLTVSFDQLVLLFCVLLFLLRRRQQKYRTLLEIVAKHYIALSDGG